MSMTSKERFLTAIACRQPDRVPIFDHIYSRPLYREVLGRAPEYYNAEDAFTCAARIGYDMVDVPLGGFSGHSGRDYDGDCYQDEWGTTFRRMPEHSWPGDSPVAYPLTGRRDWLQYRLPDPTEPKRLQGIQTALHLRREHDLAVFGTVRGPFSATWMLFGLENLSMQLYDDPALLDEVMGQCADFYISGGLRMIDCGADGITICDDYGYNYAPFISTPHFTRHVLPQLERMVAVFHSRGVPVMLHSDGHIRPLLDHIVSAGINALHPLERSAGMDLAEVKQSYGDRICLVGNVDNKYTLVKGSVADVRAQVLECLRAAAAGGGFVLASDHSLKDDVPVANIMALYETGRQYGRYPLSFPRTKEH